MAIRARDITLAEQTNYFWTAVIRNEEREEFLKPEFWAHVAARFKTFDHIYLQTEDSTFWAELLILSKGTGWAKVKVLNFIEVEAIDTENQMKLEGLTIRHRGPVLKWTVIRDSDTTVLEESLPNYATAYKAGLGYLKMVQQAA